jgi:multidrug resistance efflux pump
MTLGEWHHDHKTFWLRITSRPHGWGQNIAEARASADAAGIAWLRNHAAAMAGAIVDLQRTVEGQQRGVLELVEKCRKLLSERDLARNEVAKLRAALFSAAHAAVSDVDNLDAEGLLDPEEMKEARERIAEWRAVAEGKSDG